jgi:phosphatidylglycerol:prolipoprotein diacylglycerol transferase
MINWLHTFHPTAILVSLGPINIYWYGLCLVVGMLAALAVTYRLAKYYNISTDLIFDLAFWLIIGGLIGARIYDDLLQLPYYLQHPLQSLEIWKGGLAIHGAIIAGLLITWLFAKRKNLNFWQLAAILTPGLALGQAIGRWGNYFNQEIFGLPTNWPWGIPIDLINRPVLYITNTYFQPTFLYESLGCLAISLILIMININAIKHQRLNNKLYFNLIALYLILYSLLRFSLEFIRLDPAPLWWGWRWPQIISLLTIISAILLIFFRSYAQKSPRR